MRIILPILIITTIFIMFACGTQTDYSSYQGPPSDNKYVGGGCGVVSQNEYPLDCSVPSECLLTSSVGNTGL